MKRQPTKQPREVSANLAELAVPVNSSLKLPWPDEQYAWAAVGWIDLGDWQSALDELQKINRVFLGQPLVAKIAQRILSESCQFDLSLLQSGELIEQLPNDPHGWISYAFTLNALLRTQEAYDFLLPLLELFPQHRTIPYNLACYLSQLGRLDEAHRMLERSFAIDGGLDRFLKALCDPELAPLWTECNLRSPSSSRDVDIWQELTCPYTTCRR